MYLRKGKIDLIGFLLSKEPRVKPRALYYYIIPNDVRDVG
jgi:hypothetical protein